VLKCPRHGCLPRTATERRSGEPATWAFRNLRNRKPPARSVVGQQKQSPARRTVTTQDSPRTPPPGVLCHAGATARTASRSRRREGGPPDGSLVVRCDTTRLVDRVDGVLKLRSGAMQVDRGIPAREGGSLSVGARRVSWVMARDRSATPGSWSGSVAQHVGAAWGGSMRERLPSTRSVAMIAPRDSAQATFGGQLFLCL
jgi:hypothetical protein